MLNRESENRFIQDSEASRLLKMVGHWELYKKIVGLPGDIFEVGVFKGSSLIQWATFRHALENPEGRRIVGFDSFGAFPVSDEASGADRDFADLFTAEAGFPDEKDVLEGIISQKGFPNIELVEGDIFNTLPTYVSERGNLRVAMAHIDVDLYGPTKLAIELTWPRLVRGGVLALDDYGFVEGASQAIDEFIHDQGLELVRLGTYSAPSFVIKS